MFLAVSSLFTVQAAGKEYKATFKIAMTQTPAHPYALGANKFAELVKERTNGRINVKVFMDSTLAKGEREALAQFFHEMRYMVFGKSSLLS